jgi:prevent-host-death family protein
MPPRKPRQPTHAADTDVLAVSDFKARCLEILEDLRSSGHELLLTKHGSPIARVVPVTSQARSLRGLMKGQIQIVADIVQADFSDDWESNR